MREAIQHPSGTKRGVTLVELLIYMVLIVLAGGYVVASLIGIGRAQAQLAARQHMAESATLALERIVRSVREADEVLTASSTFEVHPGKLVVQRGTSTNATTTEFQLNSGRLMVSTNEGTQAPLTQQSIAVEELVFTHATTSRSSVVRTTLTFISTSSRATTSATFWASATTR